MMFQIETIFEKILKKKQWLAENLIDYKYFTYCEHLKSLQVNVLELSKTMENFWNELGNSI